MMDDPRDDAFAERIAKPLRAPERADPNFEVRTMSAVQAAWRTRGRSALHAARSWWLRPRTLQLSPLASLALAAGFAALVLGGSALFGSITRPGFERRVAQGSAANTLHDTVHVVRFVLPHPDARRVMLVGAFNGWEKNATPLRPGGAPGVWTVDVPLPPGRQEYAFVVYDDDGEHWMADPFSHVLRDDFGVESSVISIGANTTS